jgi:hypothetical protein
MCCHRQGFPPLSLSVCTLLASIGLMCMALYLFLSFSLSLSPLSDAGGGGHTCIEGSLQLSMYDDVSIAADGRSKVCVLVQRQRIVPRVH